ncbi:MAG: hypothetical protein OXU86_06205 [Thaumarchaeota archaeon]|nr:hypothetical protein [Nitrososphaerota archaeon]RNJ72306.1 MAG: hypothetical protein EB824_06100 [Thaumarchaeota archaeon S15]RNJ73539.1 MAG: hypothetical protein EB832_01645 [Thaumarchaeota archaeon S14]RNJ73736.1 MAG: hypothetical protein EB833_02170 [Thaumarchaeota archaeon S13]MDD9809763.1 hypothetical protein [Nitrososphaerota archaeon]
MEAQEAVERVLKISPSIRVATICDMNGKLVYHARRKSVKNVLTPTESKASLRISAQNMRKRKALSRKLGTCRYTLAEYDKLKRLVMPAGRNHLLYVTCSPSFDHNKIVRKVRTFK